MSDNDNGGFVSKRCEFLGGPLDGELKTVFVLAPPGKLPLFAHFGKKYQHVYQGTRYADDIEESGTLPMLHVQLLGLDESMVDDEECE
jgi:hypothetical protein